MTNSYKDSNREGAIRELIAAKILMEHGYAVSFPCSNVRYDIIAEKHPFIARVQIKPLKSVLDGKIKKWEVRAFSSPNKIRAPYTKNDCDFVMAVTNDAQNYAVIPVEQIPGSGIVCVSTYSTNKRKEYLNSFIAFEECRQQMS